MLASLNDILPALARRGLCLPAFDVAGGQPEFLLAVLRACESARSPAAMLVWAPGAGEIGLEGCADLAGSLARRACVPVVLHLDHARQEQQVEQALRAGFRSVMFDGSELEFEENVRRTRAMVELAHAAGATIEGELGRFGQERGPAAHPEALTDPEQAGEFVRRTGVDLLAPAVGNAHGFYRAPPHLRFDLIQRIAQATGVPLSLHGGTGIPFADVRAAARLGVRKLNVATQLHKDFSDALKAAAGAEGAFRWRKALDEGRSAVAARVTEYLREMQVEGSA